MSITGEGGRDPSKTTDPGNGILLLHGPRWRFQRHKSSAPVRNLKFVAEDDCPAANDYEGVLPRSGCTDVRTDVPFHGNACRCCQWSSRRACCCTRDHSRYIDQVVTESAIFPRDHLPYSYSCVLADVCSRRAHTTYDPPSIHRILRGWPAGRCRVSHVSERKELQTEVVGGSAKQLQRKCRSLLGFAR